MPELISINHAKFLLREWIIHNSALAKLELYTHDKQKFFVRDNVESLKPGSESSVGDAEADNVRPLREAQ